MINFNALFTRLLPSRTRPKAGRIEALMLDGWVLGLVCALMSIGLIMVASSSLPYAAEHFGGGFYFAVRHSIYLMLAFTGALIVLSQPSARWQKFSIFLLIGVLVMLVLVLLIGREVNGARRWLGAGVLTIQVSEFAKLFMIIYMADYLQRRNEVLRRELQGFLRPLLLVGAISFLLMMEPDYGATVVITVTCFAMMFLAGARLWQFIAIAAAAVLALAVVALSAEYRLKRLQTFLDPWADPYGSGYQLTQSLIAFGRGEWLGQGLGNSLQKLAYLPEAHTDFIVAVIAEEFGLIGLALLVLLFAALCLRILWIARAALKQQMAFQAYACIGIASWLALQVLINIGVASGALPTKGLTLPFVSYGGNALLVSVAAVAFVLRVDYERRVAAGAVWSRNSLGESPRAGTGVQAGVSA